MRRRRAPHTDGDLLAGTLDMMVLRVLSLGAAHGLQIAQAIERRSDDVLLVEQGSLYPALYRLEERGWITSGWDIADSGRRARFYRLTPVGERELDAARGEFERMVRAIRRVGEPA